MATLYGENADKILVDNPPQAIPSSDGGGRLRVIYDTYTFASDLSVNDVIVMGKKIPKGALVVDAYLKFTDLGANTGRLDVGWAASDDAVESADPNGFLNQVDPGTAADIIKMTDNLTGTAAGMKKFTAAVQPQILVQTDTDAASGTVELFILYSLD